MPNGLKNKDNTTRLCQLSKELNNSLFKLWDSFNYQKRPPPSLKSLHTSTNTLKLNSAENHGTPSSK